MPTLREEMASMPGSAHANLTVGGMVILGGCFGYIRKGSKASLVAGLSVGSLLITSAYLISKTDHIFEAHCIGAASSGVMAMAMGQRYLSGGKFMPAGLVAVLGMTTCAYNVAKAIQWAPTAPKKECVTREVANGESKRPELEIDRHR